jgi:hypothetical protein
MRSADDCASGADDVGLLRPKFTKGRFQMIDDIVAFQAAAGFGPSLAFNPFFY